VFRTRLEVVPPKYRTVTLLLETTGWFVFSFAAECGIDICDVTQRELQ